MSLWKRTRPLRDAAISVLGIGLLIMPWMSDRHRYYDADPAQWLKYAGFAVFMLCWGGGTIIYQFLLQRVRNTAPLHIPYLIAAVVGLGIGLPVSIFGDSIYHHGRLALQRPAMERFIQNNDAACPALRCMRDATGVTAFVWGENEDVWTGACHDPKGVMADAQHAASADRAAGKAPQARVFGRVSRRSRPISGSFIRCAARNLESVPH